MPRYHLFGETVHLANQMEQKGVVGKVNASATFVKELRSHELWKVEKRMDGLLLEGGELMDMFLVEKRDSLMTAVGHSGIHVIDVEESNARDVSR
jgi:hypothetical protein